MSEAIIYRYQGRPEVRAGRFAGANDADVITTNQTRKTSISTTETIE